MAFPPPTLEHCTRHPDRVTGRHCTRCERPACNDCLVQATVGSQCIDCVRQNRLPRSVRARHWNASQPMLATKVLIGLNVLVHLWVISGSTASLVPGRINQREFDLGVSAVFIQNGEWWRLVTAGFLHFGLLHIAMNMILLYQLGQLLEPALDHGRFVLLYMAALLGGSAGALALTPDALTGGASGAVFGLMAAAAVGLSQRGVNPMRTGIGATLVINLLITFTIPGISIGGHLGGALMGAAVGYPMLHPHMRRTSPWLGFVAPLLGMACAVLLVLAMV